MPVQRECYSGLSIDALVSEPYHDLGMDALIVAWLNVHGTRTSLWSGHGCYAHNMPLEYGSYSDFGMDALVTRFILQPNCVMV